MKIYTKTGDKGTTALSNGERVSKASELLETYGTADELNSFVGLLWSKVCEKGHQDVAPQLLQIQSDLFKVGGIISQAPIEFKEEKVQNLETWIDQMQAALEPLKAFVLPSGTETASLAHVCRTVCRRLERRMVGLNRSEFAIISQYINRLSDYFFTLARYLVKIENQTEIIYKP